MLAIPLKEAIERVAVAVEKAAWYDLIEIYAELFPEKPRPEVDETNAAVLAKELARHVRTNIQPEEVVDLWHVAFPSRQRVYYDEEDQVLRLTERDLRYAEQ